MNHVQFDLIVVGAGILGLSAAIQAQEQGLKVCIFEKNAKPVGATRRNFGMVGTSTLTHPEQQWRNYALETRSFTSVFKLKPIFHLSKDKVYIWQTLHLNGRF